MVMDCYEKPGARMMQFFNGLAAMPYGYQQPQASPRGELCPGAVIRLGNHTFQITQPLGKGSFSSVWGAVNVDGSGGEIAIKETVCQNTTELQDAENEGRILHQVGGASSSIPDVIALETTPHATGGSV